MENAWDSVTSDLHFFTLRSEALPEILIKPPEIPLW